MQPNDFRPSSIGFLRRINGWPGGKGSPRVFTCKRAIHWLPPLFYLHPSKTQRFKSVLPNFKPWNPIRLKRRPHRLHHPSQVHCPSQVHRPLPRPNRGRSNLPRNHRWLPLRILRPWICAWLRFSMPSPWPVPISYWRYALIWAVNRGPWFPASLNTLPPMSSRAVRFSC